MTDMCKDTNRDGIEAYPSMDPRDVLDLETDETVYVTMKLKVPGADDADQTTVEYSIPGVVSLDEDGEKTFTTPSG